MRFEPLSLSGAYVVLPEKHADARGWFARSFCREEFQKHGLDDCSLQCSLSHNIEKHTLRGLHFQSAPHDETKLVRCVKGRIFDVIGQVRAVDEPVGDTAPAPFAHHHRVVAHTEAENFAHAAPLFLDAEDLRRGALDPHLVSEAGGHVCA